MVIDRYVIGDILETHFTLTDSSVVDAVMEYSDNHPRSLNLVRVDDKSFFYQQCANNNVANNIENVVINNIRYLSNVVHYTTPIMDLAFLSNESESIVDWRELYLLHGRHRQIGVTHYIRKYINNVLNTDPYAQIGLMGTSYGSLINASYASSDRVKFITSTYSSRTNIRGMVFTHLILAEFAHVHASVNHDIEQILRTIVDIEFSINPKTKIIA